MLDGPGSRWPTLVNRQSSDPVATLPVRRRDSDQWAKATPVRSIPATSSTGNTASLASLISTPSYG
ncbi:MAG: hypothetical protein QXV20_04505, partial [Candidatus Hadarchaeales archaeon]